MAKFYSIAVNGLTEQQERALAHLWKSYGWWHAIPGFWLLRDEQDSTTAIVLRDQILQVAPGARTIVVEIEPRTWAASVMVQSNRDWLRQYWPPEG